MFTRDAPRIILNILVACIRQADTRFCESKHLNISVVVAYAPIDGADDSEKDIFYRTLADTFDELPRHDTKLLLVDFNAMITSDRHGCEAVIGGKSLHSSSNDNGTRLVDFWAANQLVIEGTLFQHRDIHKGTWRSPNGLTVHQQAEN